MRIKLSCELCYEEIIKAVGALPTDICGKVNYITTNSKECEAGDLFFALDGKDRSGNDFADEAISKGAIPITSSSKYKGIHVKDAKIALLQLSEYYLTRLTKLKERICITGSVGKTTTKEFLFSIIKDSFITHATIKNFNNEIGVPLTILSAPRDCEVIILELGTNHRGEIANLSKHVHPTLSVITNIGTSHIGNLGSKEMIAKEKADILTGMSVPRLICEYGESLLADIEEKKTVSCECSSADFFLMPIKEDINGAIFDFYSDGVLLTGVRFNVAGRHMLNTLALAISVALVIGTDAKKVANAVETLGEAQIRHKLIKMDDYYILDDSYNASRESVFAALQLLEFYRPHSRTALLGDILELGDDTERIHKEIGGFAYKSGIERLYLLGVYSPFIMQGAIEAGMSRDDIHINTDINAPYTTANDIIEKHKQGDIILFKASHKINLGRIIEILKMKERNYNA